jgi:prepilin-type N-terminal cleavage/methylation domain-containing protein
MKKNKAFTLIELLIVVAIIGIIAGIIVVTVQNAIHRATIARSLSFSRAIEQTLGLDLRGSWPFNGRALDRSGWNNHGTLHNFTPTTGDWVPGVIGEALRFDGVDDFVKVPNHPNLNPTSITIEIWYFPHNALTTITQNQIRKEGSYLIQHSMAAGRLRPHVWTGGIFRVMEADGYFTANNIWYHIIMTYEATTGVMNLYRNGSLFKTVTFSALPISTNIEPLYIGTGSIGTEPTDGIIDEIRIYSRAMPASYIQKRYVEGVKSLAENGGITQEEKQERLTALRNSGQLVIDLDAVLVGPIDFSVYNKYLVLEKTE